MTSFSDLGLASALTVALQEDNYQSPTPIQSKSIPAILQGADLLGIAQTGTGKTAAFALPILHRLSLDRQPAQRKTCRALVLSPTRELATQIADAFRNYGRHLGLSVAAVFGGTGYRPQIQALARGVDVLVATPGRLLDHLEQGNVSLGGTQVFVLDEADQMLDLGFVKPIRQISARLPVKRQSLFFSATMPAEIGKLASELLRQPVKVSVAPASTTVERVSQRVILIETAKKRALLSELISDAAMSRALVFTRTKHGADRVARHLETAGVRVAAIHGNKSQAQREKALAAFKRSEIRVLVATDIAARGIDIDCVTHVINYEMPDVPESYVHRIGRTARAGEAGIAISLVDHTELNQLRQIERVSRQTIPAEDRRRDASLGHDHPHAVASAEKRPLAQNNGHRNDGNRDDRRQRPHRGEGRRNAVRQDDATGARRPGGKQGGDSVHANGKAGAERGEARPAREPGKAAWHARRGQHGGKPGANGASRFQGKDHRPRGSNRATAKAKAPAIA